VEGANRAFFYTARRFGINDTVISLTQYPQLDWDGRSEYLRAVTNKRRVDLYAMDLVCIIARGLSARWGGSFQGELPSAIEYEVKKQDTRTAEQIQQGILKRLREG